MASGASNATEVAMLGDIFRTPASGTLRNLYLYPFKYDGYLAGNGAYVKMDDDGGITRLDSGATITISGTTAIADSANGFTAAMDGMVIDEASGKIPLGTTFHYLTAGTGTLSAACTNGSGLTVKINAFSLATAISPTYRTLADTDFGSAVGGAPSTRSLSTQQLYTASAIQEICWWALNSVSGATIVDQTTWAANKATMCWHGQVTDVDGDQMSVPVGVSQTFEWNATNPIKIQIGDVGDPF